MQKMANQISLWHPLQTLGQDIIEHAHRILTTQLLKHRRSGTPLLDLRLFSLKVLNLPQRLPHTAAKIHF